MLPGPTVSAIKAIGRYENAPIAVPAGFSVARYAEEGKGLGKGEGFGEPWNAPFVAVNESGVVTPPK